MEMQMNVKLSTKYGRYADSISKHTEMIKSKLRGQTNSNDQHNTPTFRDCWTYAIFH